MKKSNGNENLDSIFEALANKHRREIIYALGLQPHSITQLAIMRNLSLPAIHKHIKILLSSDLVLRKKIGRITFLTINKQTLLKLQEWLMQYHAYWGTNTDSFENYANYLDEKTGPTAAKVSVGRKGGEKK